MAKNKAADVFEAEEQVDERLPGDEPIEEETPDTQQEESVEEQAAETEESAPENPTDITFEDDDTFVVEVDGEEAEIAYKDLPELLRMRDQYEESYNTLREREQQLQGAATLASFVQSDQLTAAIINYKSQGRTDAEIVRFLSDFYEKNGLFDTPEADSSVDPKIAKQLQELQNKVLTYEQSQQQEALMKEQSQQVDLLNETFEALGFQFDTASPTKAQKLMRETTKAIAEAFGEDPNKFVFGTRKLTKAIAKAALLEVHENHPTLFKKKEAPAAKETPKEQPKKDSGIKSAVRMIRKAKQSVPAQVPGKAGVDVSRDSRQSDTPRESYSQANNRRAVADLFGG